MVADAFFRNPGVGDSFAVQVTLFKLAVAKHLCPQASAVEAVRIAGILFSPADGSVLVFNVPAKDGG